MLSRFQFKIEYQTFQEYKFCFQEEETQQECSICYCHIIQSNFVITNCKHIYCVGCVKNYMESLSTNIRTISCPYCRQTIQKMFIPKGNNEIKKFQYVSFKPTFMEPEPRMERRPINENDFEMYDLDEQFNNEMRRVIQTIMFILMYSLVNLILLMWSILVTIASMLILYYFMYIIINL